MKRNASTGRLQEAMQMAYRAQMLSIEQQPAAESIV